MTLRTNICLVSVSAEVFEVEEHDAGSDGGAEEFETRETIKLTGRGRTTTLLVRDAYTSTRRSSRLYSRSRARDETPQEVQDEDEATLRELLIRYHPQTLGTYIYADIRADAYGYVQAV